MKKLTSFIFVFIVSFLSHSQCTSCASSCTDPCSIGSLAALLTGSVTIPAGEDCSFSTGGNAIVDGNDGDAIEIFGCLTLTFTNDVLRIANGASLIVRSGGYLEINSGGLGLNNGSTVTVEEGAYLYVENNVNNGGPSDDGNIIVNGDMEVDGNFVIQDDATLSGTGTLQVDGTFTDNSGAGTGSNDFSGCGGGADCCDGGGCTPLPVELAQFAGVLLEGNVHLSWETLSETNNKGFHIERSADGIQFETLDFIEGNGTSSQKNNYSYVDRTSSGTSFYRLLQVDFDGQFEYSEIILVTSSLAKFNIGVFPNPIKNIIENIVIPPGQYQVMIYDLAGKSESHSRWIKAADMLDELNKQFHEKPTGLYYIRFDSNLGQSKTLKVYKDQ